MRSHALDAPASVTCRFWLKAWPGIVMPGAQPVDDLVEELRLAIPPQRVFKTVAGLVIDQARRLPQTGEVLAFEGFSVEVITVEGGAITAVRVRSTSQVRRGDQA